MTADTITALVNMGSAGAVIAVVIIFLRSNEKRDKNWQDFFTALNRGNAEDISAIVARLDKAVETMGGHDAQEKAILQTVTEIKALLQRRGKAGA